MLNLNKDSKPNSNQTKFKLAVLSSVKRSVMRLKKVGTTTELSSEPDKILIMKQLALFPPDHTACCIDHSILLLNLVSEHYVYNVAAKSLQSNNNE